MSRYGDRRPESFLDWIERISGDLSNLNIFSFVLFAGTLLGLAPREEHRARGKRGFLERVCKMAKGDLSYVESHLKVVESALRANGYNVRKCRVETCTRGLVGTQESFGMTLFEVGLCFDPLLNVPFIPASSLKGAFRHAFERKFPKELADKIFGSSDGEGEGGLGLLGVTDAYPVRIKSRIFDPDVITPHYPEKPRRKKLETEFDVEPTPVPFLAIAPGVEFVFYIYYNKAVFEKLGRDLLPTTGRLDGDMTGGVIFEGDLSEALRGVSNPKPSIIPMVDYAIIYALTRGIGAKTSVGYTRFKLLEYR